ncbi:hypothetical protein N9J89_01235 [Bacteroidia bacterium]|nr:hypothetical protein [Bacteroidia bacterium]
MLNTRDANYAFSNGYKVFEYAMKQITEPIDTAENILIFGFGCRSILHLLEKNTIIKGK